MEKFDLSKKVTDEIFEIVHMFGTYGENGETEGHFIKLEEAKEKALDLKYTYYQNDNFFINKMVWNEEEAEYLHQYDGNGGLFSPVEVL